MICHQTPFLLKEFAKSLGGLGSSLSLPFFSFYHSTGLFLIHFASIMPEFISTPLNILIFWLEVLITVIYLLQI